MNHVRHIIGTLLVSLGGLMSLTANRAQATTAQNLNNLKTSLTTLGTDLNKVGQGLAAKADTAVIGIKICEIAKQISALGVSTKFSDDLDAGLVSGAHPLATSLTELSTLTGNLALPAGAGALNLMNLALYKLEKVFGDLGTIVNTDLADTSKTDLPSLQKNLVALGADLTGAGLNALGNPLGDVAKAFAAVQATPATVLTNSYFNLWTGAKLENPYTIAVDTTAKTATLQSAKTTTDGFIELNLNYSFAIRQGTDQQQDPFLWGADRAKHGTVSNSGFGQFVAPWIHFPDFNTSVGYVFRGSTASTNFSASTIVGGSDLYTAGSLGFPWWRYVDNAGTIRKMQSTLDIAGGVVTDKNNLLLHPNIFVGGGFQGAYSRGGTNSSLIGLWAGRIGMARVDHPRLISGSSVVLNSLNEPEFDATWAPSLGFDITFPVTTALSVQFGGNVYFTASPSAWNLTVGARVDIDKFFSALK